MYICIYATIHPIDTWSYTSVSLSFYHPQINFFAPFRPKSNAQILYKTFLVDESFLALHCIVCDHCESHFFNSHFLASYGWIGARDAIRISSFLVEGRGEHRVPNWCKNVTKAI